MRCWLATWHLLFVYISYMEGLFISGVYPTGVSEGLVSCVCDRGWGWEMDG